MPGKHYKGMPKYNSDKQRMAVHASKAEKKGMPKLSAKQAKHIDTNKDGEISGADFPINRGIGNYKGSGNFAMKNKMLSDSAKNGIPMQKNYSGMPNKYWTAIKEAAKGSNLTTAKQRYDYSLKASKKKEAEAEANAKNTKK